MTKRMKKIPLLILISFLVCTSFMKPADSFAFSDQIIQRGATGDDVVELQSRLQFIGFYNGTIDGVYGWGTYWAVRKYQEQFGLGVDGLVGQQMKAMLEKSTKYDYEWVHKQFYEGRAFTYYGPDPKKNQTGPIGSRIPPLEIAKRNQQKTQGQGEQAGTPAAPGQGKQAGTPAAPGQGEQAGTPAAPGQGEQAGTPAAPDQDETPEVPTDEPLPEEVQDEGPSIQEAINVPQGFSENDIRIMAQAVYGEARGEPYIGQVAVAAVILNRINSPTFPNTPSGVIFEPRAFTAVADGQIYLQPNETSRRAVLDAINGQDPSGNALYYFNPDTATSGWIWTRPQIKKIGKHIFCK